MFVMGGSEEEVRYILVSSITVPLQLGIAVYSILAFDIAWISYVLGVGGGRRCKEPGGGAVAALGQPTIRPNTANHQSTGQHVPWRILVLSLYW